MVGDSRRELSFAWPRGAWDHDGFAHHAEANAEFIANAREDVPWLLAELEAAEARERDLVNDWNKAVIREQRLRAALDRTSERETT